MLKARKTSKLHKTRELKDRVRGQKDVQTAVQVKSLFRGVLHRQDDWCKADKGKFLHFHINMIMMDEKKTQLIKG